MTRYPQYPKPTPPTTGIPNYCTRCGKPLTSVLQVALTYTAQRVTLDPGPQWDDPQPIAIDNDTYTTGYRCPHCHLRLDDNVCRLIAKRVGSQYHRIDLANEENH